MRYLSRFMLSLAIFIATQSLLAQPQGPRQGPRAGRLEEFRKMRLVEVLKLKEDEAVRFFAKQSAHEDKIKELMKARNDALDDIDKTVREKGDAKGIQKSSGDVLDADQKIFAERQRYQEELKNFLTPEQFGKFLVFERNFEHHMREAMQDMFRERGHRDGND